MTALLARPHARRFDLALVASALLVGFGATFGVLSALSGGHPAAQDHGPAAATLPTAAAPLPAAGPDPSPAALDAQWLDYSDSSTCADWAGGDGVTAIRLSSSQVAWFFADTYLGPAGPSIGLSRSSGLLHNSVVVQTTAGNSTRLVTLTGGGACATAGAPGDAEPVVQPASAGGTQQRYWDADGIRVGGAIVKFYNGYEPGPIPYIPVGTTIASFPVSQLSAAGSGPAYGAVLRPELTPVPGYTPPGGGTPIVWGSALLTVGRTVYVYGWQSPEPQLRDLYLARVPEADLTDFAAWQFYSAGRWAAGQSLATPVGTPLQGISVATGFSVVRIDGRYWLIQAAGAGDPDIDAYPAPAPWGPFSTAPILLYQAPGIGLNAASDYRVLYEARAEPALSSGDSLVISYNVNSEAVTAGCVPMFHYTNAMSQPQFISVPLTSFSPGAPPVAAHVLAGRPEYPQITELDPQQWSSSLSYPGGCPPVPAVSGVTAQTAAASAGKARLTWPDAGLGLLYRVYAYAGSAGQVLARTVSSPEVTLTGLTPGVTYQFRVVPVNIYKATGPAALASARIP
jgi:hypothetical protein